MSVERRARVHAENPTTFRLLSAAHILASRSFDRCQDLQDATVSPERCALILFVSHRWETLAHPDPAGRQHGALVLLLREISDLAQAVTAESPLERTRIVPDLARNGTIQAAVLLVRLLTRLTERPNEFTTDDIPARIGVWYDYSCLPQEPRTPRQDAEFRSALLGLPDLVGSDSVSLIALRHAGDEFEHRGWCLAESSLTHYRERYRGLSLRIDRVGRPLVPRAQPRNAALDAGLRSALSAWRSPGVGAEGGAEACILAASLLDNAPEELFAVEDDIEPTGLGETAVRDVPAWHALVMQALYRSGSGGFCDLAAALGRIAADAGVSCAKDHDVAYVMLVILVARAASGSQLERFFSECLARHVERRSLLVRASRVDRGVDSNDLGWHFAD
jgi:hypothetical protein